MIALTSTGLAHDPEVTHNVAAWGAVKEVLRINGGRATREQLLDVLAFCQRGDRAEPNVRFLHYALRRCWLSEES